MPLYILNFIGGLLIGYYLLNGAFRNLVNQIMLILLRLAHRLTCAILGLLLKGLNWCYQTKGTAQQPIKVKSYTPTPVTAHKQGVGARDVVAPDGKRAIWFSDEQLAEMMKNPDVKISEKKDGE
jgi:hypothetical protein